MRRILFVLFILCILPLSSNAQGVGGSVSTSYNKVTVTGTVDAGWSSSDFDSNCGFTDYYPFLPYSLYGLSSFGAISSNVSFSQSGFAGECQGSPDNVYSYQLSYSDLVPGNRDVTIDASIGDGVSSVSPDPTSTFSYSVPGAIAQPKYYIVAILYIPPGNNSTNGFAQTESNGTTDSVSSTFTNGASTTFSASLFGGAEWTFGSSTQTGNSQSFSETHSSGFGHSLPATLNVIDRSKDLIYLWLNPQVTFTQSGPNSADYTFSTVNGEQPDILACTFADFQNPNQMSPNCQCAPYTLGGAAVPGVCSVCANPSGCTAADFADIVNADELASSNPALTPTQNWCTSDNRYCYTNVSVDLPAGSNNTFTATDSSLTTQTFSQQKCHSVSYKDGGSINILGAFSLGIGNTSTFTWCDSESTGTTSGTSNQAAVSLGSKTAGCTFGVDIYEDTVYHTFVLQPSGGTYPVSCIGQ